MENSLFWDAKQIEGAWDRTYSSDDFAAMFAGFWETGIIPNAANALMVEPIENSFAVVVNPGDAFIKGRFYQNTNDVQFTLTNGNGEIRVDYIALRFDYDNRKIFLRVLEGVEGEGAPSFARTDKLFDLLLAKVTIPANAQYLTDEMVEDLRGTANCPWVNLRFDLDAIVTSFEDWYQGVKTLLDENTAIQLQNQIDELEAKHNQDIANLTAEYEIKLAQERKYDTVVKNDTVYIRTRPYDASIDTDLP